MGITIFEIILEKLPYEVGNSIIPTSNKLLNTRFDGIVEEHVSPMGCSKDLCEILCLLCTKDLKDRPKLRESQDMDFYRRYVDIDSEEVLDIVSKVMSDE